MFLVSNIHYMSLCVGRECQVPTAGSASGTGWKEVHTQYGTVN